MKANIVLSSRNKEELENVAKQCKGEAYILPLDLEKPEAFEKATQSVVKKYGSIDLLINNGGISQRSEASQTSIDIDRKLMEINYLAIQKFLKMHCLELEFGMDYKTKTNKMELALKNVHKILLTE